MPRCYGLSYSTETAIASVKAFTKSMNSPLISGYFLASLQDYKEKIGEDPTKHFTDEELKERDRPGQK